MTLTKKTLNRWLESMRVMANNAQKDKILERFSEEPHPYEWSEQDISVQIENYITCGEFVKSITPSDVCVAGFVDDEF